MPDDQAYCLKDGTWVLAAEASIHGIWDFVDMFILGFWKSISGYK